MAKERIDTDNQTQIEWLTSKIKDQLVGTQFAHCEVRMEGQSLVDSRIRIDGCSYQTIGDIPEASLRAAVTKAVQKVRYIGRNVGAIPTARRG